MAKKKAPSKAKTSSSKSSKKASAEPRRVIAELVDETEDQSPTPVEPEEGSTAPVDEGPGAELLPVAASEKAITSSDPLVLYLNEIRRYPLLDREKEIEIAKRYYESKDPEAAQTLVKSNLRFVVKVAAEYSKFGARMIDLIQEGNVGLMHAVKEFNPYKGVRLITYAVWWIRGYIQEYLMRQYSLVRIGTTQNQRKLFYQLQKQKEQLDALGENPDYHVIAERLGIPADEVESMAQRLSGRDISLDRPLDEDSGARLSDYQKNPDEEPLDEQLARQEQLAILKEKIEEIRPTLNERETILLEERLLSDEPLTLQEIGEKYGITREAVRQAEVRLMKKIKDGLEKSTHDE